MSAKRYAIVGLGGRSRMFRKAIAGEFRETSELVALCDLNRVRLEHANETLQQEFGLKPLPMYAPDQFDQMIRENKVDTVIVTTIDRTHHRYIIRAMENGCDAISEKPMTTDAEKCQAILDAIQRTGKRLRVTFNYRYAPHNTKLRELIMNDTIGRVTSVHFEWLLDTNHGADYFRRWHRDKRNSGGLMVHKSTHHFDLVNWWIDSAPQTVFAQGELAFYGRANAEERGETKFYSRAHGQPNAKDCPFALDLESKPLLKAMYLNAEQEDGYFRDQSVFGDGISIEDTMGVLVRYRNKAIMTYSLNAYMPWEGFRVAVNGTKGRLEMNIGEKTYINAGGAPNEDGVSSYKQLLVHPMFGKPYEVEIPEGVGGHGGGDTVMLNDIFGKPVDDPYKRAASHVDGARSILTGIAANQSFNTGLPVRVDDLVRFY